MRVGRLLRSTEGVGAESHRVAKLAQGGRSEESRGVAESQHIAQASRLDGGEALTGPARCADTTCDETMVAWQASRRQARGGRRRQAWRRQAWRRQAWRVARWALRRTRRTWWVGVVSMRLARRTKIAERVTVLAVVAAWRNRLQRSRSVAKPAAEKNRRMQCGVLKRRT